MKYFLLIAIFSFTQPDREIVYSEEVIIEDCNTPGEIKIIGKDNRIYVIPISFGTKKKSTMPIKRID